MTISIFIPLPRRRRPLEEARQTLELPLYPPRAVEREMVRPDKDETDSERGTADVDFYI
jgi:hypothetical protein